MNEHDFDILPSLSVFYFSQDRAKNNNIETIIPAKYFFTFASINKVTKHELDQVLNNTKKWKLGSRTMCSTENIINSIHNIPELMTNFGLLKSTIMNAK